jgi:hypothetical protein
VTRVRAFCYGAVTGAAALVVWQADHADRTVRRLLDHVAAAATDAGRPSP